MQAPTTASRQARTTGAPTGLAQQASLFEGAFDRLLSTLDSVAPGARGELVHQFLLRNGYFDDPDRARQIFQSSDAVDEYLDQLDVSAAASQSQATGITGAQVMAATMGFGLGLGVAFLVSSASGPETTSQRQLPSR